MSTNDPRAAFKLAIEHIEHMAAWIGQNNRGYSFEALGEDMPGIKAALGAFPATPPSKAVADEIEGLAKGKIEKCLSPLSAGGKVYDIGYATGLMRAAILVLESIPTSLPAPDTAGEVEKIVAWLRRGGLHAIADQIELGDHHTAAEGGNS